MDRFDLVLQVREVKVNELMNQSGGEASVIIAERVSKARMQQKQRYNNSLLPLNSVLDGEKLHEIAKPDSEGQQLLTSALEKMRLSARSYHRVLRVARTIADLEGAGGVRRQHIAEALSYRHVAVG